MSEDNAKKIFSKNLRYFLELNGYNQTDLIKRLNVSSATASNWCTGIKLPRMDKIQSLCNWFGIELSDLLEDRTERQEQNYYFNDETREIAQEIFENSELRSLFDAARDLPPERLRSHIDFIKSLKAQEDKNSDEGC